MMTPERWAGIRELYDDAAEGFACCGYHVIEAFGEALAEVDRLWAQLAAVWDEGEAAGRENADDGYPDPLIENPYRTALASGNDRDD